MTEGHMQHTVDDVDAEEVLPYAKRLNVGVADSQLNLTHRLFRFPAKFHPPIVRTLLDEYTKPGDTVLDPFCGSGTLLVEAAVSHRQSIGIDVDPLAVFVSRAKTVVHSSVNLEADVSVMLDAVSRYDRGSEWYDSAVHNDLTANKFDKELTGLEDYIPSIPNLAHWFRNYVVIDLAWIRRTLERVEVADSSRMLFYLSFASIIRNASNADPVPVSGLEVTRHMLDREARGRAIDPFALFRASIQKSMVGALAYSERASGCTIRATQGDATNLPSDLEGVDAVLTSPPYHNAVDYYRRHQLEMFWLGLVSSHEQRLQILPKYIGRHRVPARHPLLREKWEPGDLAEKWESSMRADSSARANDFRHYSMSMRNCFSQLATKLKEGSPLIMVVGRSTWNKREIPTDQLMEELAAQHFKLDETLWYPVVNRYMSYTRKNSADISREYVLVFRRSA